MKYDLMNSLDPKVLVPPQVVTDGSSILSSALDVRNTRSVTFIIILGTITDADADWTVTVHEGSTDTQADHTAVADTDLIGTEALAGFDFADDTLCKKIGYNGIADYVSLEIDNGTANTGNLPIAVVAILEPYSAPAENPPT